MTRPHTDPIFIVGPQRSGTTLLASLIAAHPLVRGGPEAKVFEKIPLTVRTASVEDPQWPRKAIDALTGVRLSGERVIDLFGVDEESLHSYLSDHRPSQGAMLAALFEADGRLPSGCRWVEKTPNHLEHLDTITREFPSSPIVRIVRDPRDVAASMTKVPWGSHSRLANAWSWRERMRRTRKAVAQQGERVLTIRYEDLLREPALTMRRVANHIDLEFVPDMLSPERGAESVTTAAETWKQKNSSPLDASRAEAWRHDADDTTRAIGALCAAELREFDYPDVPPSFRDRAVYAPRAVVIETHEAAFIAAGLAGIRLVNAGPKTKRPLLMPSACRLRQAGDVELAKQVTATRLRRLLTKRHAITLRARSFRG